MKAFLASLSSFASRYARWLHGQWPAGRVERLPVTGPNGETNIPRVYVAGDLQGVPLLKFAADSGVRAVRALVSGPQFSSRRSEGTLDLVIAGAGVSGMAAALEARRAGLRFEVLESAEAYSTLVNFPKGKPIFTYPTDMTPAGDMRFTGDVKESLLDELRAQTADVPIRRARVERLSRKDDDVLVHLAEGGSLRARGVIVAIGRSGDFRKLGVPGEDLDKVSNRLHDPADFRGRRVLVVGGGDSALETALALAESGATVSLCHRKPEFARPKPENVERLKALAGPAESPGRVRVRLSTQVREVRPGSVLLARDGEAPETLANDAVFSMIGREAPLQFFRRSRIGLRGEWSWKAKLSFAGFFLFCAALYNWKSGGALGNLFFDRGWWPTTLHRALAGMGGDPTSLVGVTLLSASFPSFWYTLAYSALVVVFGVRRIRRRRTPYVFWQTVALMAIQVFPLFLLPEILLPWMGDKGWIPQGVMDALFPVVTYGHGREYWRSYGFVLAWPLMIYNVFTDQPLGWWLAISVIQTFVFIPGIIYFWGKGAYCGWICSCGALAETLGDAHREKMPHGPTTNRWNLAGQAILGLCVVMLVWRVAGWVFPSVGWLNAGFNVLKTQYKWWVDVFLAGVVGYGFYFWFSGRVWCRWFCPLAALMHIYARFSRFRILADKKKCISCNVCTSVCHMGIDVMNFANKGKPMEDPECVRCSACVQMCPTGVLSFGQVDRAGQVIAQDRLAASLVRMREKTV